MSGLSAVPWRGCILAVLLAPGVFLRASLAGEAVPFEATVVTLEGEEQRQTITGLSATELLEGAATVPLKDIASIVFAPRVPATPSGASLYLRNDDVLANVGIVAGDESRLTFGNETWGEMKLEYKFLSGITFAGKDRPRADVIEGFLKAPPPKEDQLLTAKGETISGYIEKFSDKEINFNAGGQKRAYAFEQLAAFKLAPLEEYKPRAEFLAAIELRAGSHVTGKLIALQDGKLTFEALNGQPWSVAAEALASISFTGGRLVYLSDVAPAAVEEKPYAGGMPVVYRWRRDHSVAGGAIRIGDKAYEKGLGVHSYARLEYALSGQYTKLLSDVGLDAAAPATGSCVWKVLADDKEVASGTAKAGGKPEAVRVDVKGVQRLTLVCDYGVDDSDAGDHLDWGGARLVKP